MNGPARSKPSRASLMVFIARSLLIALHGVVDSLLVLRPWARLSDHILEAVLPVVVGCNRIVKR